MKRNIFEDAFLLEKSVQWMRFWRTVLPSSRPSNFTLVWFFMIFYSECRYLFEWSGALLHLQAGDNIFGKVRAPLFFKP